MKTNTELVELELVYPDVLDFVPLDDCNPCCYSTSLYSPSPSFTTISLLYSFQRCMAFLGPSAWAMP